MILYVLQHFFTVCFELITRRSLVQILHKTVSFDFNHPFPLVLHFAGKQQTGRKPDRFLPVCCLVSCAQRSISRSTSKQCRSASVTRPIYVFIRFALYSNAPSRSIYVYFFCFNSDASIRMMILVSVIRAFCLDDFIIDIMYNKSIHFLDNMQYERA